MELTSPTAFFLLLSCSLWDVESQNVTSIITVTNGAKWGNWGEVNICTTGKVMGFSLKVQPQQGFFSDDTSLNGIRLICTDKSVVTSTVGKHGYWSDLHFCQSGFLNSFSLRVSPPIFLRDNKAANNIKFNCTDGTTVEGNGHAWGEYGSWSESCEDGSICGIRTKVDNSSILDSTGLNDVIFFCCT